MIDKLLCKIKWCDVMIIIHDSIHLQDFTLCTKMKEIPSKYWLILWHNSFPCGNFSNLSMSSTLKLTFQKSSHTNRALCKRITRTGILQFKDWSYKQVKTTTLFLFNRTWIDVAAQTFMLVTGVEHCVLL